jgi:hypothetical protein
VIKDRPYLFDHSYNYDLYYDLNQIDDAVEKVNLKLVNDEVDEKEENRVMVHI